MAIKMRTGLEADFDPNKMMPGEWAVSTDTRYIRMCFVPGVCLRIATYEAFEADMELMRQILSECQTIQQAVERIQSEINNTAIIIENYKNQAKQYTEDSKGHAEDAYNEAERAKMYADNASAVTGVEIAKKDRAGIIKGGENYIAEDGTLTLTKQTTDKTLYNSHGGGIKVNEIGGVNEQDGEPSPDYPQEIKAVTGKNLLDCRGLVEKTSNGVTFTPVYDSNGNLLYVEANGTASADTYYRVGTISLDRGKYIASGSEGGGEYTYKMVFYGMPNTFFQKSDSVSFELSDKIVQKNVDILISSGVTADHLRFYPMIRPASITDNTYTPYGCLRVKASGKNHASINNSGNNVLIGHIKAGKNYTLCFIQDSATNLNLHYDGYNGEGISIQRVSTDINAIVTFASIKDCVVFFNGYKNANQRNFMLVEGTHEEFIPYEPYQESSITLSNPITLNGIGNIKDRIVRKDDVWGIERKFVEETISRVKSMDTTSSVASLVLNYTPKNVTTVSIPSNVICDSLIADGINPVRNSEYGIAAYGSGIYVRNANIEQTVDAYNAWLAEKPINVLYELAVSTFEPFSTADQIALNSLVSFNGVTYLSCDSEIKPIIEVEYGTSKVGAYTLKAWNKAENNRIDNDLLKSAILSLGGNV